MIDGGIDIEIHPLVDNHVALAVDSIVIGAIDIEGARAADE